MTGFPSASDAKCQVISASGTILSSSVRDCRALHRRIRCVHGKFPNPLQPSCPSRNVPMVNVTRVPRHSLSVIVPAYPHLRNIFHYSFVIATATHLAITHARPSTNNHNGRGGGKSFGHVTFIFRGPPPSALGAWQAWVTLAARKRLRSAGIESTLVSLSGVGGDGQIVNGSEQTFCVDDEAIILGPRPSVNLWPFPTGRFIRMIEVVDDDLRPVTTTSTSTTTTFTNANQSVYSLRLNDSSVPPADGAEAGSVMRVLGRSLPEIRRTAGLSVPVEALAFRRAAYDLANVSTAIPRGVMRGVTAAPDRAWIDLPEAVVGYARRNTVPDPSESSGGLMRGGPIRRLSDADEAWLQALLRREAAAANMTYRVIEPVFGADARNVAGQVRELRGVGVLVGLHGANLVNAAFMPAFGGLVEIGPARLQCYAGGMNSGLVSWRVRPPRVATVEESGCPAWHERCKVDVLERRVLLDEWGTRTRVALAVREAVEHGREVRRVFGRVGKVGVKMVREEAGYVIEWERAGEE